MICSSIKNNKVYGKYSIGGGGVLSDPDKVFCAVDDSEVIESYKTSMQRDIERAGVSLKDFKTFKVLDVGTGRQAIAFHLLGAQQVCHYDISPYQVERMKLFIESNSLKDRISTECIDLVKYSPPSNSFDFVYLHGIVQHFSHTGVGLKNCLEAVKKNGYLWLYFYRSGTFVQFIIYLLRDLIKHGDLDPREYFINTSILYNDYCKPNYFTSGLMDNLFATYSHLYTPKSYLLFLKECGFEVIFSSKLDPFGSDINHKYAHQSVILVCKRAVEKDLSECNIDVLSPERTNDNHNEILQTINEYNSLKHILHLDNIPKSFIMSLAFKLLSFVTNNKDFNIKEADHYHKYLQLIFKNARSLIEKEFSI